MSMNHPFESVDHFQFIQNSILLWFNWHNFRQQQFQHRIETEFILLCIFVVLAVAVMFPIVSVYQHLIVQYKIICIKIVIIEPINGNTVPEECNYELNFSNSLNIRINNLERNINQISMYLCNFKINANISKTHARTHTHLHVQIQINSNIN